MASLFPASDRCWLGGPGSVELAHWQLEVDGADDGLVTIARDHALLVRRHGGAEAGYGADGGASGMLRVEQVAENGPPEGFEILTPEPGRVVVRAADRRGLVAGFFHVWNRGPGAVSAGRHRPATAIRMLNDWDNMVVDAMGSVERGYAGPSILFSGGEMVDDLSRFRDYARLLASVGINALCLNNVNVNDVETTLVTDRLDDVARAAAVLREYGIACYVAVNYAAPLTVGDVDTADPLDDGVRAWWRATAERVWGRIGDFGGFVVKADSENRPGPFRYDRTHVDGANMLAEAVAPHGGTVFWRCFVYDNHQDWRDRSTDRARAAADHFAPFDGQFADNVVLQVKFGPIDFQTREGVSPLLTRLRATHVAIELQITQEYTGQQKHVCYLPELWRDALDTEIGWETDGGPRLYETVGVHTGRHNGFVAVSNVGADPNWTGHPFAQANLYAFGRLAWEPSLTAEELAHEWLRATYAVPDAARDELAALLLGSWQTYEAYTAPLGVGFMVTPHTHYGPSVDGYEYTPWGTYHFADRDGVGVDRTVATGSGMIGLYPPAMAARYETLDACPDALLLFFHHVPYGHVLHSGSTVIQHIYDSHFAGVEQGEAMIRRWHGVRESLPSEVSAVVDVRFAEQLRSAIEWRDQVNTYFWRKSGVPDARGRLIHR
ncbi:alpha-glucuronidase [Propioniciclava soli]|uniref:Alpha-glucuronidase n=1 Tax=Propioniciclava soli TaxID=2775081 RepID=A0ABZ3CAE4_9ACTN